MIEIIRSCARPQQIEQMLDEYKFYIKLAVDINRRVLAGGGEMHYDIKKAGGRRQEAEGIPINKFRGFNQDAVFLALRVSKYMFLCFA